MRLWQITVEIRERATEFKYAVVIHSFVGRTRKEATGYMNSHMKTDSFFAGCVQKSRWNDVECVAQVTFDDWISY
jgi:hypothetical protein